MDKLIKIILYANIILLASIIHAQYTPPEPSVSTISVNSTNELVAPTASELLQANPEIFPTANIQTLTIGTGLSGSNYSVTNATTWSIDTTWLTNFIRAMRPSIFSVIVDTSPTISYLSGQKVDFFATDSELKVEYNNQLVYRASTIQDSNFLSNSKSDLNCQIFFQCSEVLGDSTGGRRWWPFLNGVFTSVASQAQFMSGSESYPPVGNIIFFPNVSGTLVDGTAINSIWNLDNADLQPTSLRFNGIDYEQSETGVYIWRIPNWASRQVKPDIGYTLWQPTSQGDWTLASSGTPTFNEDGSITFDSRLERLYITQGGNDLEPNSIYIVSFEVQIPSGTEGFIALYSTSNFLSNYNIYIASGTTGVTNTTYSYLRIYPDAYNQWIQVYVLLNLSQATSYYIYNGGNNNVVSIRNFKLLKL